MLAEFQLRYNRGIMSRPHLSDLMTEVAAVLPHEWKDIGIKLGVSISEVEKISVAGWNTNNCFMQVFMAWELRRAKPYTWEEIIIVLESSTSSYEYAQKIKSKLLSNTGDTKPGMYCFTS